MTGGINQVDLSAGRFTDLQLVETSCVRLGCLEGDRDSSSKDEDMT